MVTMKKISLAVILALILPLTACVVVSKETSTIPESAWHGPAEGKEEIMELLSGLIEHDREVVEKLTDILIDCGLTTIKMADEYLPPENGYTSIVLSVDVPYMLWFTAIVILSPEGEVMEIYELSGAYYIYINGNVEYGMLSAEDYYKYRDDSIELIDEALGFPGNSEYPDRTGWKIFKNYGYIVVQSTVVADDGTGDPDDPEEIAFQVMWENGIPVSITLDEVEYLQN